MQRIDNFLFDYWVLCWIGFCPDLRLKLPELLATFRISIKIGFVYRTTFSGFVRYNFGQFWVMIIRFAINAPLQIMSTERVLF